MKHICAVGGVLAAGSQDLVYSWTPSVVLRVVSEVVVVVVDAAAMVGVLYDRGDEVAA